MNQQSIAAMRKTKNKHCVICGTEFTTISGNRRYCSNSCRHKAYYRRQKKLVAIGRETLKIEENQRIIEKIRLLKEEQT
jgi:predicted nucleic acid-binding Zn ribbon protein